MKIVFLGTPRAAVPSLESLLDAGHRVPLVVTRPDRPVGRSREPMAPPVKRIAIARGIEVSQPRRVRGEKFAATLARAAPDLLVVVAYGRILPESVLRVAPAGAVNVHFSLLPDYRGAAPVQWALANGEVVTGVTTMQISAGLDEGDVLLQRETPIAPGEHAPALERRLSELGAELLLQTVARLDRGDLVPRAQDHGRATSAPLLSAADGEVDLEEPAERIAGKVRGFDPWPGVWVLRGGRRLRILEARAMDGGTGSEPAGTVLGLTEDGLMVRCGQGTRLAVTRVQPAGRRAVAVRDAVNGRQISPGDRLRPVGSGD